MYIYNHQASYRAHHSMIQRHPSKSALPRAVCPIRHVAPTSSQTPVHDMHPSVSRGNKQSHAVYCCCCCIMVVWLCSWNLSPSLCCVARVFCTHRAMQPFSREERALEVKSSTHEVKQFSNMLWNICAASPEVSSGEGKSCNRAAWEGGDDAYRKGIRE